MQTHYFMANRRGKGGSSDRFPLLGLWNHCIWWLQPWNQKMTISWQESYDKPRQCTEKQRYYSADQGPHSQGYGLSRGHILLWELNHTEGRAPKNWCLQTVVLEKTPESPLDSMEIKPVNLKENQPWILVGRNDAKAPVFWLSNENSWLIGRVLDVRKDWGQTEKRLSEDEMAGWHHRCNGRELRCNGHELQKIVRDREVWHAVVHGVAESDTTEQQQVHVTHDLFFIYFWIYEK